VSVERIRLFAPDDAALVSSAAEADYLEVTGADALKARGCANACEEVAEQRREAWHDFAGEASAAHDPLAGAVLKGHVADPARPQRGRQARGDGRERGGQPVQEGRAGPDSIELLALGHVLEAHAQHLAPTADALARQPHHLGRGIKRHHRISLLRESQRIAPDPAARIEDPAAGRHVPEEALVECRHVEATRVGSEAPRVTVVEGDRVDAALSHPRPLPPPRA
jgi:hypothetical protein